MGCSVSDASDGLQALERFAVDKPELVLLDMVMTGMYGLDVLAKMVELDPAVRVLVATADVQTSTSEQVRAAGAKGLLNKPVTRDQLTKAMQVVLSGGDLWN
jgi:two-component system chemotaxis response regulator CheY